MRLARMLCVALSKLIEVSSTVIVFLALWQSVTLVLPYCLPDGPYWYWAADAFLPLPECGTSVTRSCAACNRSARLIWFGPWNSHTSVRLGASFNRSSIVGWTFS